ncbi:2-hydroxychromene-2-carboxylate isomerase [Erythrobacteraceae bacterium WH01K]|nr:2-hydroxychromene-2-carboxylate isomerase [Erythrobacteraceae bacterium WH01K]
MAKTVEFIFDFSAPNGYLAWYPLKDIAARTGADIAITPVYLGGMHKLTGNAPPMMRDADVKGKVEYARLEFERFLEKHGLTRFRMHPDLPFNSILVQRALVACGADRRGTMLDCLLPAIWEDNIAVGDPEAVAAVLERGGFDARALLERTQDAGVKQQLADNTGQAVERGAFGIPTFFIGDEMFFGKERLGQIEEMLGG